MKTYDQPYAIDDIALNVQVELRQRGIITRDGRLVDLQAFKLALVSSLKKPITILRGEDVQAKLAEGQAILTQVLVFVVIRDGRPVDAGFRKGKIMLHEGDSLVEYVIRRVGDGTVQVVGEPTLTPTQQREVYLALARDLARVKIFDTEPPAVAAALRDMLGEP
jgi:hypothetical protein